MSDAIVKNLNFGEDARVNVFKGIQKLTQAVSSTLGASGKCVMLEDHTGRCNSGRFYNTARPS
jgi:chaperonin GroEL (HSP60 family)